MPTTPGSFIPRFAFWNPSTWAIPELYWDTFSSEQRLHAICKQLGKVIAYADMLGVNTDDITARLKAIEEGQLDPVIEAAVEQWFEDNAPQLLSDVEDLQAALPISEFDSVNTVKAYIDSGIGAIGDLLPDSEFSSASTVKDAIDAVSASVQDVADLLPDSEFSSASTVKDALDALGTNISTINADGWVTPSRLSASAKKLHSTATVSFQKVYIDNSTGDDATGAINDPTKPFETLQAACLALNENGNHFDFVFKTTGTYYIPYKVFVGSVIHFRAPEISGTIEIQPVLDMPAGGFYFYDTHVNFNGNALCRFHFNAGVDRLIEFEGSTLWCENTTFTCEMLALICGSSWLNNTIVNGYVKGYFNFARIYGLTINNDKAQPALDFSTSHIRIEATGLYISHNTYGNENPAVYIETCYMTTGNNMSGDASINYYRYLDARGSIVTITAAWIAQMDALALNASQFASLTTRVYANNILGE